MLGDRRAAKRSRFVEFIGCRFIGEHKRIWRQFQRIFFVERHAWFFIVGFGYRSQRRMPCDGAI